MMFFNSHNGSQATYQRVYVALGVYLFNRPCLSTGMMMLTVIYGGKLEF